MGLGTVFSMLLAAILAGGAIAADHEKAKSSLSQFEALKKLSGDWVEIGKDAKPTEKVVSSFRVTAAGHALEEKVFPGTDHEMVTMYHMDGANLVLTHYCTLGNQPRMRAEPATDTNKIVFKFTGATNLKSDKEMHMHEATLTLEGDNRFLAEWTACQDGAPCHQVRLSMARKSK
jgi:hypothetical protein